MKSRGALFACACLGLLSFGIVFTTLGSLLPSIIERFGLDKAQAGALFPLSSFGILAGSLVFGPMADRYGYKGILATAIALIVLGLEGIAFAPTLAILGIALFVIGAGGGIINGGSNALVADMSSDARGANLQLLGVFFGVGAVGVPFMLATLTGAFTQKALIAGLGALVVIPLLVIVITEFPAPKQAQGFPIAAAGRLVRDPLMLLMGFMLFLESGMEITVGGWTSTYVNDELAVTARTALIILSLYWMGTILTRIALGWLLRRSSPFRLLFACMTTAFVGAVLLLVTRSVPIAIAGVFFLGVGFAPTFPSVLGFIGDRYETLSGTAFSLALAMALTGGMILPYFAGLIGQQSGMRASFVIVPAALLVLMGLLGILSRKLRPASPT
jgi:fucose permease